MQKDIRNDIDYRSWFKEPYQQYIKFSHPLQKKLLIAGIEPELVGDMFFQLYEVWRIIMDDYFKKFNETKNYPDKNIENYSLQELENLSRLLYDMDIDLEHMVTHIRFYKQYSRKLGNIIDKIYEQKERAEKRSRRAKKRKK